MTSSFTSTSMDDFSGGGDSFTGSFAVAPPMYQVPTKYPVPRFKGSYRDLPISPLHGNKPPLRDHGDLRELKRRYGEDLQLQPVVRQIWAFETFGEHKTILNPSCEIPPEVDAFTIDNIVTYQAPYNPLFGDLPHGNHTACFTGLGTCWTSHLSTPNKVSMPGNGQFSFDHRIELFMFDDVTHALNFLGHNARSERLAYVEEAGAMAFTTNTASAITLQLGQTDLVLPWDPACVEHVRDFNFPEIHSYERQIPIFNARNSGGFFDDSTFMASLYSLPLCMDREVPREALVLIGYTASVVRNPARSYVNPRGEAVDPSGPGSVNAGSNLPYPHNVAYAKKHLPPADMLNPRVQFVVRLT